jgi:hypothetical protein
MNPDDEAAARGTYLAAFDGIGECPCRRQGETISDHNRRVGGAKFSIWDAARFHPDSAERELALLAGVEDLRRWLHGEDPFKPRLPGGYGADLNDDPTDPESIKRSAMEQGRDVALAKLTAGARQCGVVVTAASVKAQGPTSFQEADPRRRFS